MKILVIKQTSLGDVLHSTGHVRAIKQRYPDSELHLLTATSSADIYRHNPWVDRLLLVDRYRVKRDWYRNPRWCINHMKEVMSQVREQQYKLAFDLQGLAKSVIFLYGARANKKFVKGHWPGLQGYKNSKIHALKEMDGVLALAGISEVDTHMEFASSASDNTSIQRLIDEINPRGMPVIVISPFTRWPSKDWSLSSFISVASSLESDYLVLFTGADDKRTEIDAALDRANLGGNQQNVVNLAGRLQLTEFAELVRRAALMLTGDSFPMHLAAACATPVVALFGPTDEARVGPLGDDSSVIRAPDCRVCDRRDCTQRCLDRITPEQIVGEMRQRLAGTVTG